MRRRAFATVLVSQSALLREGLARILVAADFRIVASAPHMRDVATTPLSQTQTTLLVLDVGDDPDGTMAQIELFKEQHPSGRVVVLAGHLRRSDVVCAYRTGANYFTNVTNCGAFIKALELVMLGETILSPELLSFVCDGEDGRENHTAPKNPGRNGDALQPRAELDPVPRLSTKKKCILRCIVEGDSNKIIARKVDIAEATVKVHVKAIFRKVRLNNRTQAAIWAMNNSSLIWSPDAELPPAGTLAVPLTPVQQIEAPLLAPTRMGEVEADIALVGTNGMARKSASRKHA